LSPQAIADPPVFGRARSAVLHDGKAREFVHRLKYGDRPELARMMGRIMASAGRELLENCNVIVPVPLHRWRLWRRRYNQAAVLAEAIASLSGLDCDTALLRRIRHTRSQTSLTKPQRQDNLRGAFSVPKDARARVTGAKILLIDDVLTSGATANAAARVLLRTGAASVDILTFARVMKD
jgi:Predicted amidophosphoribosyltransferases